MCNYKTQAKFEFRVDRSIFGRDTVLTSFKVKHQILWSVVGWVSDLEFQKTVPKDVFFLFSSPEHFVLKVSYCDRLMAIGDRPLSTIVSNDISS